MSTGSSDDWDDWLEETSSLLARGDFPAALSRCQRRLETEPHWNAYYLAGQCCQFMDRLTEAEQYLRLSLATGGDLAGVHCALGIVFQRQSRLAEAITALERALQLEPGNTHARNSLGLTFKLDGQIDRAHQQYSRAVHELIASIVESQPNTPEQPIMPPPHFPDGVWVESLMHFATRLAAMKKLDGVAWPTGDQAVSGAFERGSGGTMFRVVDGPDGKRVLFLHPNLFNTVAHRLRQVPIYCTLLFNLSRIHVAKGNRGTARERLVESIAFTPIGLDYRAPREALYELDSAGQR